MSDILAILAFLTITGLAIPALLTSWWTLFPGLVNRARRRAAYTPWKSAILGVLGLAAAAIPIGILLALPFGPAKFAGWLGLLFVLALSSMGTAGLAAHLGHRIRERSDPSISELQSFLYGAASLELAAVFPGLGWFIFLPAGLMLSTGAAIFALLRWSPGPAIEQPTGSPDGPLARAPAETASV